MTKTIRMALTALAAITMIGLWTVAAQPAANRTAITADPTIERAQINPERATAEIVNLRFAAAAGTDAADAALQFIAGHRDLFKLDQPESELQLSARRTDTRGNEHLKFKQRYQGLRVWGCEQIAHRNAAGELYLIAGQTIPTPKIKTTPAVDANVAASRAMISLRDDYPNDNLATESELLIYPDGTTPRLAYLVEVTGPNRGDIRWNVFVDATSGEVISKYNNIHFDGPTVGAGENIVGWPVTIQTYQIGTDYYLIDATQPMFVPPVTNHEGVIVTYDDFYNNGGPASVIVDPNADNNFNDDISLRAAVAGHLYAELTYEYFLNTHGRNSYDDAGSSVRVNVHDPVYVNNAYWNGYGINFADGDGVNWRPFSGSLDVVAHELAHGVTSWTAGLIYTFQSGALNESYSDFFGAMVDRDEWLLGDEIRITTPGYLRNMENPHLGLNPNRFPFGYQPAHMDEFVVLSIQTDNGGVHINSGIPNKVGYLVSTTTSRESAEQIWYHTLTNYLSESSDFAFWASMTFQSAIDLFGMPSAEVTAVAEALDSVGLGGVAIVNPALYGLPVAMGGTVDTAIQLKNLGTSTVSLLSASGGNPELTVNATFPIVLAFGETATIPITFDATAMASPCDLGEVADAVTFTTDDAGTPSFDVPVTVSVGYTAASEQTSVFTTGCASLDAANDVTLDGFAVDGVPVMFESSLMLGILDNGTKKTYSNTYYTNGYAVVDDFISGTDGDGRTTQTLRYSTLDSRLQGMVRYTYVPSGSADCDFYLVDYTITNNCDTPLTVLSGVFTDFDIFGSGTNHANYDDARQMVYMRDAGDAVAAGWAMLSDDARNMRAINNPGVIWDGFTDDEIYDLLNATTNTMSGGPDDWSVMLTFGESTIGAGDSTVYSAVLMQSNSGTAGLQARIDSILSTLCPVEMTGDVNLDGVITSADIIYAVGYIFKGGSAPLPIEAAGDVNCDGSVTSADIIYLVNFVFKSAAPPCDVCSIL